MKRFIYAASSSTYGDSKELPKIEERIGRPLSPYAITKVVNEYFAKVYSELYGLETIGLRYFNVFGKRQDPNVAYGKSTTLFELYDALRENLAKHDPAIANIDVTIGSKRAGDIPHSLASVDKTKMVLEYKPKFSATGGFNEACEWYCQNLK